MSTDHKQQMVDELVKSPQFQQIQHGRGFGKTARMQAATRMLQVERPVASTSRAKPASRPVSFPRATAGMVVWREIPSWHQKREPNSAAALLSPTKSPPWVRKRKARAKTKLAKTSRKANRA